MNRIKDIRKANKVSQKDFAEKTGISLPSISAYERGIRHPKQETLEKIAQAYNVPVWYVRGDEDPIYSKMPRQEFYNRIDEYVQDEQRTNADDIDERFSAIQNTAKSLIEISHNVEHDLYEVDLYDSISIILKVIQDGNKEYIDALSMLIFESNERLDVIKRINNMDSHDIPLKSLETVLNKIDKSIKSNYETLGHFLEKND